MIRRWSVAVTLVAIMVGPFTWWQVEARVNVLQPGGMSYFGSGKVWHAGGATEYRFADRPGSTFTFGFSILNSGGHDVTIQSIDEISGAAKQQITVDPTTNGGSVNVLMVGEVKTCYVQ